MKTALILGASSGIGLDIARNLKDYLVIGVGKDVSKVTDVPSNLKLISRDLSNPSEISKLFSQIKTDFCISCPDVIIFSCGCAYYGLHENIEIQSISDMVNVNFMAPMAITSHYLSYMKQRKSGRLIYISSVTANHINPHGAAYGATKSGITSFARSIFEESRKRNIKVNVISPDLTSTELYRNADFRPNGDVSLSVSDVTNATLYAINQPDNVDVFEITIRPQVNSIVR